MPRADERDGAHDGEGGGEKNGFEGRGSGTIRSGARPGRRGQASVATRKIFDYLAVRRPVFALAQDNEAVQRRCMPEFVM